MKRFAMLICFLVLVCSLVPISPAINALPIRSTEGVTPSSAGTAPEMEWEKTFGGTGTDLAFSVEETSDGGFIIAGLTDSYGAGESDVYLIKTDASGIEQWSRTIGGTDADGGMSVQQTSDGGFIIAGLTDSYGAGSCDVYLIKTDASGIEQWSRTIGGTDADGGMSVQQTSDGGFIIAGYTCSYGAGCPYYVIKTDASGIEEWSRTFGDPDLDGFCEVKETSDGGFIIAGNTYNGAGMTDAYLVKMDANGNEQWGRTFGGPDHDYAFSVDQSSDGGFIVAGLTGNVWGGERNDIYLMKTDGSGNQQWSRTFGGTLVNVAFSVRETSDGGFIITGLTESYGAGESDVYLIKTDGSGNEQWGRTFGGTGMDWGCSVQETSDGGFIIAGLTESYGAGESDVYLIKVAPSALTVTFPDPNLEAAIREAIGKPTGPIYTSDLEGLTFLEAGYRDISDLMGLEYCTSLTELQLQGNQIGDISPLSMLESLTYLNLGGTQISDVSPLSTLTSLATLYLWENQISDISPLSVLTSLTSLHVGDNQVSDISPLSTLTSLTDLNLGFNQISDISPLSVLTSLTSLHVGNNQVSDISPLSTLTSLTGLCLSFNQISDISTLVHLTSLTWLLLRANPITDISPLSALTSLSELNLFSTEISDISPLSTLTSLTDLNLGFNQISDISPLSTLTNLEALDLRWNQIGDLSVLSTLSNVFDLNLDHNQISDISPLSSLTGLMLLHLRENEISDINPLVDNAGLSSGDFVDLRSNPLSATSINTHIPQLEARGVRVRYDTPTPRPTPQPQTLVMTNPAVSLDGITIYEPEERTSHPCAGHEEYVYLVIGQDAVRLTGPWISSGDGVDIEGLFTLEGEVIELINPGESVADGFRVVANSRLMYSVSIVDFEYEINLARVELIKEGDVIRSQFIFLATGEGPTGGGVAHNVTITAVVDGASIRSTVPITIEAREASHPCPTPSPSPSPALLPDLTVTSVSAPSSATVGETISVSFTVENAGTAPSGSFSYKIFLAVEPYIGTGASYHMGGTFTVESLDAGEARTATKDVGIPSVESGDYYVAVYVDPYPGAINEEDENNNIGSSPISISILTPDFRQELAERFCPILYLHSEEIYEPEDIRIMASRANDLRHTDDESFSVQATPHNLYLSNLQRPQDWPSSPQGYYIDVPICSPVLKEIAADCYLEKYENAKQVYSPVVYARVTEDDGWVVLQYWFFYYYNDWWNNHEGDWEMIELLFDPNHLPDDLETSSQKVAHIVEQEVDPSIAAYGHHHSGWWRHWRDVEKEGTHPVVYVACGSHGNYFEPGRFYQIVEFDRASGSHRIGLSHLSLELLPELRDIVPGGPHEWLLFLGYWGEQTHLPPIYIPTWHCWEDPTGGGGCIPVFEKETELGFEGPKALLSKGMTWNDPYDWVFGEDGLEQDPQNWQSHWLAFLHSPANLHVYDPAGRHVGQNEQGGIDLEIMGAQYIAPEGTRVEAIWIPGADLSDEYRVEVEGTGEGTFGLELLVPNRENGVQHYIEYADVPVTATALASIDVEPGTDFGLQVDADGDGTFESEVSPTIDEATPMPERPGELTPSVPPPWFWPVVGLAAALLVLLIALILRLALKRP